MTVVHDGNFIGVAAPSATAARAAAAAIRAEWKSDPQPSNKELFEYLKKNAVPRDAEGDHGDPMPYHSGSIETAMKSADHHLQQTYTVAYIAHCPLEPRAALAQWNGDRLTVWTGTQRPFGVRTELAQCFPHFGGSGSRADAGYGLGLRRKTYGRDGDRGGAAGACGETPQ